MEISIVGLYPIKDILIRESVHPERELEEEGWDLLSETRGMVYTGLVYRSYSQ